MKWLIKCPKCGNEMERPYLANVLCKGTKANVELELPVYCTNHSPTYQMKREEVNEND